MRIRYRNWYLSLGIIVASLVDVDLPRTAASSRRYLDEFLRVFFPMAGETS